MQSGQQSTRPTFLAVPARLTDPAGRAGKVGMAIMMGMFGMFGMFGMAGMLVMLVMPIAGCSRPDKWEAKRPPVYKAGGVVVWEGKPADGAIVTFLPREGKHSAVGQADRNGRFRLGTFSQADGAVAGEYAVKVEKFEKVGVGRVDGPERAEGDVFGNILPKQYSDPKKTPLAATVTQSGPNEFTFEISGADTQSGPGQ